MPLPIPLRCPRCGAAARDFSGCAACREEGIGANPVPPLADLSGLSLETYPGGPWGWPSALSAPVAAPVTLGEGGTPVIPLPEGGPDGLWVKYEGANPTGSHKDRAMAVGVAAALAAGADTVAAASSGNAGAAVAAYAARAGLRCVVFTTDQVPEPLRAQIDALGAVRVVRDFATRNAAMQEAVERFGWYPLTSYASPAPGGNAYANEGYKSVAYELARDVPGLREGAGAVVVPTCRADLLSGIARGFRELRAAGLVAGTPRLVAAEPAGAAPYTAALALAERADQERVSVDPVPSPAFSLGESRPVWQGLDALWGADGAALAVPTEEFMAEHRALAARGLFLEPSSAVGVAAARRVARERAGGGPVVVIGTATGLKDTASVTSSGTAEERIPELAELLG
ncbi:pyridoxal-phosphate dependent enzyme [Streptomyces sp. UNOB3_S3]|uniref:threonine synthase n=1 Tax=Streptomyces sp. UNOB3_S3 TaxID=2871682 RepID=UPI001E650B02|nr:pyridoxal-phosphate dependent enzyme [Streptomyces sp. UNOB3_S3]MCC3775389.1 pyridoxal-phosphate dependent enzyme [Streptomyces sp. UNOB3_S3]